MKKLITAVSAAAICFLVSCNSNESGGMSDKAKKNLEASHIVSDAFMSGDVSKIDNAVDSSFVDHTDRGDKNRDSLKAMITMMKKQNSDMKMTLAKEVADDDYVFSAMGFTGTSDGSMGMPKGPYDFHVIEMVRFKDGKAVEHWEYTRDDDMMKWMASMAKPTMDSTKAKMPTKKK
jgi:predicted SnoaL-like aldol condensation-catalyzing enzyme